MGLPPGLLCGLISNMVDYTQVRTKDLDVSEQGLPMGKGGLKESLGSGLESVGETSGKA